MGQGGDGDRDGNTLLGSTKAPSSKLLKFLGEPASRSARLK